MQIRVLPFLIAGLLIHSSCARPPAAADPHPEPTEVRMVVPPDDAARYWPRWRGPSGQGVVEGTGYPDRWSDPDNVLWRVNVPGSGNSSPIVWEDRIFLTTAYDEGARRSILAFDREDGRLLWETFAPDNQPERAHPKNGYASGTPTTNGRHVYAYLGNHGLLAVDFHGNTVWHREFGPMDDIFHGSACSPLLYRDRVIVFQDHRSPSGSFIAAFDKATGETRWWTRRQQSLGWSSPVAIHAGDRDEIIVSSQNRVHAYHPDTGAELWHCDGNTVEVTPTPVAGHGFVFASSGRAGPTLAIRPGGSGNVSATHVQWQSRKGSPFIPSPLLHDGLLYMVNDMIGVVTCYDARSGQLVWQERLARRVQREGFSASPVAVDGKIFFTNDEGETFVLRAGRAFELLHVNQLNARTLASPALVEGHWYFRTAEHLLRIGHPPN
jgi:outer membrane protein assembly factor BamB